VFEPTKKLFIVVVCGEDGGGDSDSDHWRHRRRKNKNKKKRKEREERGEEDDYYRREIEKGEREPRHVIMSTDCVCEGLFIDFVFWHFFFFFFLNAYRLTLPSSLLPITR